MTGYFERFEEVLGDTSSTYFGSLLQRPEGFTYGFYSPVVEATEAIAQSVRNDLKPWRDNQRSVKEGTWTSAVIWNFDGGNLSMALKVVDSILETLRDKDSYPCKLLRRTSRMAAEEKLTRETENLLKLLAVAAKDDTPPLAENLFRAFWSHHKRRDPKAHCIYVVSRALVTKLWTSGADSATLELFLNGLKDFDGEQWSVAEEDLYEVLRRRQSDLEVLELWEDFTEAE